MQLNDWRDLDNCKVGAELGIFQAPKGDMQTVKRFFPRAQLQQMQAGPVVEHVQRGYQGAGQGSWNSQPQHQYANNSNGWNSAPQPPAPPPQYQQQPSFGGGWNSQPQQQPQQPQDDVPF